MVRPNRFLEFQFLSNGFLQLRFAGVAVSGQDLLGRAYGNLGHRHITLVACQQDDTGYFPERNPRFWILVEGEDIFNDHLVRFLIVEDSIEPGVDFCEASRQ